MNKHLEVENPQKRYYLWIFHLSNLILLGEIILENGKIIPDMEELVVDKENEISSLKLGGDKILPQEGRRGFREPNLISEKRSPTREGMQFQLRSFSSPSPYFLGT